VGLTKVFMAVHLYCVSSHYSLYENHASEKGFTFVFVSGKNKIIISHLVHRQKYSHTLDVLKLALLCHVSEL